MQELFIYLLKSSGLIAAFFLSYHFLLRKETFFTSNRWFLIAGLITSATLPLFFIKRIVLVEKPKISIEDLVAITNQSNATNAIQQNVAPTIDWLQMVTTVYILIVIFLFLKIVVNVFSLFKILNNKQIAKQDTFSLVDLQENIAPFSFFNFIVYNSSLYSQSELESILLHEKVHSQQKHSFDVLLAKLFSILFWFNPFIWLYKKAIVQNLEYIADSKAIQQIEDKKVYQKALLKVVTHQSCLPITNHFYQSLIKKRIVMLNKNQSHKRNSWKYAIIIPALIAFVLLFQIKIVAQERALQETISKQGEVSLVIDKNSSEYELKNEVKRLKEEHGVILKYSKIKRNANGEITGIKVEYKDKNGNKGVSQVNGKEPIRPIHFFKNGDIIGFGKTKSVRIIVNGTDMNLEEDLVLNILDSMPEIKNFDFNFEAPEIPESIEAVEALEVPEAPEIAKVTDVSLVDEMNDKISKVIVRKNGDKPLVIINGKVITDNKTIQETMKNLYIDDNSSSSDGGKKQVYINWDDARKMRTDALAKARIQLKKMRPTLKKNMEKVKAEMERIKPEMERAREDIERSRPDMEKAKEEMQQAKEEMIKAKVEMEKMKAEMEKMKADLKKQKK